MFEHAAVCDPTRILPGLNQDQAHSRREDATHCESVNSTSSMGMDQPRELFFLERKKKPKEKNKFKQIRFEPLLRT